jgi:hypothetical protein
LAGRNGRKESARVIQVPGDSHSIFTEGQIMHRTQLVLLAVAVAVLPLMGCGKGGPDPLGRDHVCRTELKEVRLGDGIRSAGEHHPELAGGCRAEEEMKGVENRPTALDAPSSVGFWASGGVEKSGKPLAVVCKNVRPTLTVKPLKKSR